MRPNPLSPVVAPPLIAAWPARLFVLALLVAASAIAAPPDAARHDRTFADSMKAYDENRLPDAIAGWKSLLDQGQVLPEVLFNLGNAYYRNGDLGEAIRAYRHAQRLAPRDPDIRANLGFAAQTAGIEIPAPPPLLARLLAFSQAEWRTIAALAFWLLFLILAAAILWPRVRPAARPAAAAAVLLMIAALAGLWTHRQLHQYPECVVMTEGSTVLSGPLESATPLLTVPAGTLVRQLDRRGSWIEVRAGTTRGWMPAKALSPVR
ncbi:MAG: tetratricopeptide repeat protein [Lentisphaerae bacterium]|nr:tetratricopeptide repeat protein [Lentisphaerota bacterium]